MEDKPPFETLIKQVEAQIDKRRGSWKLTAVAWEDVRQMIMTRAWVQYPLFHPEKGEFSHWLSRLITNAMTNILRDNHGIYSKPCILGCVFNTGDSTCSKTRSGRQCSECPIYRDWEKRKLDHFNVKQTLPLETHEQEVNSIQGDFLDMEGAKTVIDEKIRLKLTRQEWRIYRLIYIQGKTEHEAGKALGYKRKPGSKLAPGYLTLLNARHKFVVLAKQIIEDENLA